MRLRRAALAAIREQEERTAAAMKSFIGRTLRLSEIGRLERDEFTVFLGLLDTALRGTPAADGRRDAIAMGEYAVPEVP